MNESVRTIRTEIEKGIALQKCQQCGCMRETLDTLASLLAGIETEQARELRESLPAWNQRM